MEKSGLPLRWLGMLALAWAVVSVRPLVAHSAESSPAEADARDATSMFQAFIGGDLDTFAAFTYPAVVTMAGGKDGMKAILAKGLTDMRAQGFAFVSVSVDKPTRVLKAGNELHAVLPMEIVIKTPQGNLHAPSYLIGVSQTKGKTWTFVDTDKLQDKATRDRLFPRYNQALEIPPKKQPWIVPPT
jgi:hypothetical protein